MDSILTDILRLVHHGGHFKNLDYSEGSMVHPGDFASGLFAVVISSLLHSKEPSTPTLNSSSFQNLGGQILQTKT